MSCELLVLIMRGHYRDRELLLLFLSRSSFADNRAEGRLVRRKADLEANWRYLVSEVVDSGGQFVFPGLRVPSHLSGL
jgi:hypothetical protein